MKLSETKVFRDPIYTYIKVDESIIWNLINTKEFQRLRRIRQLGGTFEAFHTADHTRFAHSLGVYELSRQFCEYFPEALSERDQLVLQISALLHDVGHGPFSHALESALAINHEKFSIKIILDCDTEINKILSKVDDRLALDVTEVINKTHPNKLLIQLVSSQIDLDRMDYILRDAYFCAVPYGNFDLTRVFRVMRVVDGKLVFKESGMHAIEDYMMSRYHMYWQVYYHPVGVSFEMVLQKWFQRVKYLINHHYQFQADTNIIRPLFNDVISVADYIKVDEATIMYFWQLFVDEKDEVLSNLSYRLLYRKLYKYREITIAEMEKIKNSNINDVTFAVETQVNRAPYSYHVDGNDNLIPIFLQLKNGDVKDIAEVSPVIKSVVSGTFSDVYRLFYNEDFILEEI